MLPFTSYVHGSSPSSSSFENISPTTTWTNQNALLHGILGVGGGGGGCSSSMDMMMTEAGGSSSIRSTTTTSASTDQTKALAASKSHSEAERRRRERINGHLATLRTLLPNTTKTDKASLLAEVVQHVKELKKKLEADVEVKDDEEHDQEEVGIYSRDQWWPFPRETDELTLGYCHDQTVEEEEEESSLSSSSSMVMIKVSLSCDDRPDLVSDLTQALRSVRAKVVKAEMATVGGRTKSVLVVQSSGSVVGRGEKNNRSSEDLELGKLRKALKSVVERKSGNNGGKSGSSVVTAAVSSTTTTTGSGGGGSSANVALGGLMLPAGNKRPRTSSNHHHHHHRLVTK